MKVKAVTNNLEGLPIDLVADDRKPDEPTSTVARLIISSSDPAYQLLRAGQELTVTMTAESQDEEVPAQEELATPGHS